jgi:hypothetical protein
MLRNATQGEKYKQTNNKDQKNGSGISNSYSQISPTTLGCTQINFLYLISTKNFLHSILKLQFYNSCNSCFY